VVFGIVVTIVVLGIVVTIVVLGIVVIISLIPLIRVAGVIACTVAVFVNTIAADLCCTRIDSDIVIGAIGAAAERISKAIAVKIGTGNIATFID
jgi:hypothetical protein